MREIPKQAVATTTFADPVDLVRKSFEASFPDLIVTSVSLRKDVAEVKGRDGWKTFEETGGFTCQIEARRRSNI